MINFFIKFVLLKAVFASKKSSFVAQKQNLINSNKSSEKYCYF